MPKVEPCPCCSGKMTAYTDVDYWICMKKDCLYTSRDLVAHNKLSIKVQRSEQLERFAELAVPIVERELALYEFVESRRYAKECKRCLAALPEGFGDTNKRPENLLNPVSTCCGASPQVYSDVHEVTQSYVMIDGQGVCSKCDKATDFKEREGSDDDDS